MYKFTTRNYLTNDQDQIVLPAGNYKGILLHWEYTNDSDSVLSVANLGSIKLFNPQGGKVWDVTLERIAGFNVLKGIGQQNLAPVAAANAGQYSIYVPFHFNDDKNICRLGSGYVLEYLHTSLSAIVSAANLTVMLQRALGVQRYFPVYQDYNIRALSAEVTPEEFARKNLAFVTINPTTNITNIRLEKDSNMLYDMTDEQADSVLNLEKSGTGQTTYAAFAASVQYPWILDMYKDKNLTEILGSNYKFGAVSSDTTITGMSVEFMITENALDQTSQVMQSVKEKNAESPSEKVVA